MLIPIAVTVLTGSRIAQAQSLPTSAATERYIQTLLDAEVSRQARLDAVHSLLDQSDRSALVALAAELIARTDDQMGSRTILLDAIAAHAGPPASLIGHIKGGAQLDDPRAAIPAIRALGAYHDRETVRWLYGLVDSADETRDAVFSSLANAAVRQDLGDDHIGWTRWLEVADLVSESEWDRGVIARLDARRFQSKRQLDAMTARLVAAYRDLALSSDAEARTVLLASLLLDDMTALQNLGFELIARELAEARPLGHPVSDAAIRLLADPDALVRTTAAGLVNELAPDEAQHAVVVALLAETDPIAAGALLVAAARWPDQRTAAPAVNWLELRPDLAQTATQTLDELLRAGLLDDQWHTRIVGVLRQIDASSCNASCLRLLVALGDADDWESVRRVLLDPGNPLRTAAAEALLSRADTREFVIEYAASNPELFDITWRAIALAEPSADDFRTVLSLPAPDEDSRRQALDQIAAAMTFDQIVALAQTTESAQERARLLRPRALEPSGNGQRDIALVLLAESELKLESPEAVIAALDRLSQAPDEALLARANDARVRALILIGRADEAEMFEVDAQVWIDTVIEHADLPAIVELVARIESRFPDLTEAQRHSLDTIKLATAVEPGDIGDQPPSPPDP